MMDDKQLLHAYARERSESAFGELVTRQIDFVYATALRVLAATALALRASRGPFSPRRTRNALSERFFVPFRAERTLIDIQNALDD
jgi:hypothetical protein